MLLLIVFFFYKQKTAYEMRISDWSSDVCSSDLASDRMGEFFLFLDPTQLWLANLVACIAIVVVSYAVLGAIWPCLAAGAAALFAPQYGIRRLRLRRLRDFDRQLPDMLMALSGALRAGSGVQTALRHIAAQRSEGRRVGKGRVSTVSSVWCA